ncbi:glutamate--tRNA ligase [candidate division NPL-UPA2 bacterium]|nr:glutamate--tRNA ligase [candidate division NPL-UPA2 bacterium]
MTEKVRVRFAPSPTGSLHVGGARTALFNYLFTRHNGGSFVLRIEDTDQARSTQEALGDILNSLRWLGLDWDEGPDKGGGLGPYYQMQRLEFYKNYADELLEKERAYFCYCSPEELAERKKEALRKGKPPGYNGKCRNLPPGERADKERAVRDKTIRFKAPDEGVTEIQDLVRGKVEFENILLDDFVIMKSQGVPTFIFANVVDDHLMGITHIIRGDEHLSNTPRQLLLYQALGFPFPSFGHLSMILGSDGKKLSKRTGAVSLDWYRQKGYLPQALVNYLTLLGWGTSESQELFSSMEEIVGKFSLKAVSKNPAIFDLQKLDWMNGQYIKRLSVEELTHLVKPYLKEKNLLRDDEDEERLKKIVALEQERLKTLAQITEYGDFFFLSEITYDEKALKKVLRKEGVSLILREYRNGLKDLEPFTIETVESVARKIIADMGIKGGALIHPTRVALTGRTVGPGLFELMALLGRKVIIKRLDKAINRLCLSG